MEKKTGDLLHRIAALPDNWWVEADNGQHGYNYRTEIKIANTKVLALLDGGSGINSVTEEMLIGMLNKCWEEKTPRDSKLWPVIQLERWPQAEMVMGIAAGKPLTLAGSAVLLVHFCDIDSRLPDVEVLVRCKIFPKGSTDWHGLIIGAEALDCKERGGLAHRVTERAHVFDGIGVRSLRTETLNSGRVDQAYAVHIVHTTHPVAFVLPSAVDSDEFSCARLAPQHQQ